MRAIFAAAVGGVLIYFNTMAAQNFLHTQFDARRDVIETAQVSSTDDTARLTQIGAEVAAITAANANAIPRPLVAIDAAIAGFDATDERNAARLRRLGVERGLRLEYDRLQAEAAALRAASTSDRVASDN